jgi:hypothetical protein
MKSIHYFNLFLYSNNQSFSQIYSASQVTSLFRNFFFFEQINYLVQMIEFLFKLLRVLFDLLIIKSLFSCVISKHAYATNLNWMVFLHNHLSLCLIYPILPHNYHFLLSIFCLLLEVYMKTNRY